ncbi:MAG: TonB-dependent receptor [Verrucomicrobia bacterium]|nr:TonB-dependent receptor [Verrucomicrobiota bacterium]
MTKSAFQRSRPRFNYRTYLNVNSTRTELRKTYGIERNPTFKIKPGFDFTYIKPVSKSFGFTIGGAISSKFNPHNSSTNTWVLNPTAGTGIENPFLQGFTMQDTPKFTDRYSGRVGIDWRFAPNDVLTLGYSQQYYDAAWIGRRWQGDTAGNPTAFSSEFTQGRPNAGVVQFTGNAGHKYGTTWTPEFKYTHNGSEWKSEVRGAYSHASYHYRCLERGHFQNIVLTLGSFNAAGDVVAPTVRMDQTHDLVPRLTAVLASGETPDPRDVNNFVIGRGTEFFREGFDVKKSLFAHTRRVITVGVPVVVKVGGDVRQAVCDVRGSDPVYTYVGADGRAGTRDDAVSAAGMDLVDGYSVVAPPFGQPKFKWPSQYKLYDLYLARPNWWSRDLAGEHSMMVTNSKFLVETITSGFVRLDASFFHNRVTVVGGGRFQNYRSRADAGEVDTLGLYVRDEDGNLITNPATGQPIRATGTALAITEKTNIERAVTTKGIVNGIYPSFNAVYRMTENIQVRAGYASSISYPNLNQLAAVTTVSDITASPRRLTANSPLQPWLGRNYDLDLEYYTATGGSFTLAYFRKDISNFVNSVRHLAGTSGARAALEKYGYGELLPLNFEVVEQYNGGGATTEGWEFGLHQDLNSFLPSWASDGLRQHLLYRGAQGNQCR